MKRTDRKRSASPFDTSFQKVSETANLKEESHQMTLNRPFGVSEGKAEALSYSIEYHLTAQLTNTSLTTSHLSLILEILQYQAIFFGMNFNMILAMYELYFRILGQKRSSKEIKEPKIRLTLVRSEIMFKITRNHDWNLGSDEFFHFDGQIITQLKKGLMSRRTYGSRFRLWRPEKFVTVKAVPVDILFLKRKDSSQPYSGYCKGYGESHPSAHFKKTPPSAELDGADVEFGLAEEIFLFQRCTNPYHLLSESLLIWYYNEFDETI